MKCYFCRIDVTELPDKKDRAAGTAYHCPVCGEIRLTEEAAADFAEEQFSGLPLYFGDNENGLRRKVYGTR